MHVDPPRWCTTAAELCAELETRDDVNFEVLSGLKAGRQRRKLTATSTIQWYRKLSPPKVSSKREFLRFWLEIFGKFSPELPFFGGLRLTTDARKAL